jgi:hypothetical protein
MMQIVCQWCGHRYTMPRDALIEAIKQAEAANEKHHVVNCPKCRKVLKIQVAEMKRRVPPDALKTE